MTKSALIETGSSKMIAKKLPLAGAAMGVIAAAIFAGFLGSASEPARAQSFDDSAFMNYDNSDDAASESGLSAEVESGLEPVPEGDSIIGDLTRLQQEISYRRRQLELNQVELDILTVQSDIDDLNVDDTDYTNVGSFGGEFSGGFYNDSNIGQEPYVEEYVAPQPVQEETFINTFTPTPTPQPPVVAAPTRMSAGQLPVVRSIRGTNRNAVEAEVIVSGGGVYTVARGQQFGSGWTVENIEGDNVYISHEDDPSYSYRLAISANAPTLTQASSSSSRTPGPSENGYVPFGF